MTSPIYYTERSWTSDEPRLMALTLRRPSERLYANIHELSWAPAARLAFSRLVAHVQEEQARNLPWIEPRTILDFEIEGAFGMQWDLGLSSRSLESQPTAILRVDRNMQASSDALLASVHSILTSWCANSLHQWCDQSGVLEHLVPIEDLCSQGRAVVALEKEHILVGPDGTIEDEAALAYRLARNLAGEVLFDGLHPVRLVVRSDVRGPTAELMTDPRVVPLKNGTYPAWSAVARLIVSKCPYSNELLLQVLPRKRRWVQENPGSIWGMRSWTGFLLPAGPTAGDRAKRAMPFRALWKDGQWQHDLSFAGIALRAGLTSIPSIDDIITMPGRVAAPAWLGMGYSTRFGATSLGRTMTETDEQVLLDRVEAALGDLVAPAPASHRILLTKEARRGKGDPKPKTLGLSGLLYATTQSVDQVAWLEGAKSILGPDNVAEGSTSDDSFNLEALSLSRQFHSQAIRTIHGQTRPILWVLHKGDAFTARIISEELKEIYGEAIELKEAELPPDVHILAPPGEKQGNRFDQRVGAWQAFAKQVRDLSGTRPLYALICAPKFIGQKPEDVVNVPAAIHALASFAECNAHYVLPIERRSTRGLANFAYRVQSAAADLLLAHNGHLSDLQSAFKRNFAAGEGPDSVIGLSLVRAAGSRRMRDAHIAVLAATRFKQEGLFELRIGYRSKSGSAEFSKWMPFREGLRQIAKLGKIELGKKPQALALTQQFIDAVITEACTSGQPLVLVDSTSLGEFWPWIRDEGLQPGELVLGTANVKERWRSARIARIKTLQQPPLRTPVTTTYEMLSSSLSPTGNYEHRKYPVTQRQLLRIGARQDDGGNHYVGVHEYTSTMQPIRGQSGFRATERYKKVTGLEKGLRVRVPLDPLLTGDTALPASLGITVAKPLHGDDPDRIAAFVMDLRLGYGHTAEWTTLPAPLFFAKKISDYFVHHLLSLIQDPNEPDQESDSEDEVAEQAEVLNEEHIEEPPIPGSPAAPTVAKREIAAPQVKPDRGAYKSPDINKLLKLARSRAIQLAPPSIVTRASIEAVAANLQMSDLRLMFDYLARPEIGYTIRKEGGSRWRSVEDFVGFLSTQMGTVGAPALINYINDRDSRPRPMGRHLYNSEVRHFLPPVSTSRSASADINSLPEAMIAAGVWERYAQLMFWSHVLNYSRVCGAFYRLAPREHAVIAEVLDYIDRSNQMIDTQPVTQEAPEPNPTSRAADPVSAPPVEGDMAPTAANQAEVQMPAAEGTIGSSETMPQPSTGTPLGPDDRIELARSKGHALVDALSDAVRLGKDEVERKGLEMKAWVEDIFGLPESIKEISAKDILSRWSLFSTSSAVSEIRQYDPEAERLLLALSAHVATPGVDLKVVEGATRALTEVANRFTGLMGDRARIAAAIASARGRAQLEEITSQLSAIQADADRESQAFQSTIRQTLYDLKSDLFQPTDFDLALTAVAASISPPEPPAPAEEESPASDVPISANNPGPSPSVASALQQVPTLPQESDGPVEDEAEQWLRDEEKREVDIEQAIAGLLDQRRSGLVLCFAEVLEGGIAGISPGVLKALAAADLVIRSNAEQAEVEVALKLLSAQSTTLSWDSDAGKQCTMAAILAACLRPALYMPDTPARNIISKLVVGRFGSAAPLHKLAQLIDEDCQRLPEVRADQLRAVLEGGQGAWESRLQYLVSKAAAWRKENPDVYRGFSYQLARKVWDRVSLQTDVAKALDAIASGDAKRMKAKVDEGVRYLSGDLDHLIDTLADEVDIRQRGLKWSQRDRLMSNLELTRDFLQQVQAHLAANPASSAATLARALEEFAASLRAALLESVELLRDMADAELTPLQKAVLHLAERLFEAAAADLSQNPPPRPAIGFGDLITRHLLESTLNLGADMRPVRRDETAAACVASVTVPPAPEDEEAPEAVAWLQAHIAAGRLWSAQAMMRTYGTNHAEYVRDHVLESYRLKQRSMRDELAMRVEELREDIALGSAMMAVDDTSRREFDHVLGTVAQFNDESHLPLEDALIASGTEVPELGLPQIVDFYSAHQHLNLRVRDPLEGTLREMHRRFRLRLNEVLGKADTSRKLRLDALEHQITDQIGFSGLITAHERLRAIEQDRPEPATQVLNAPLREYQETFLPLAEAARDILRVVLDDLNAGRRPDCQLRDLSPDEVQSATQMILCFKLITDSGTNQDVRKRQLKEFFSEHLQMGIGDVEHVQNPANNNAYRLTKASIPASDAFVPPSFGTGANGRYAVRVHTGRAGVGAITSVGQQTTEAGFSLINAQLTRQQRAEAAATARNGSSTNRALTVDASLVVHLALNCESRMVALLGICLPLVPIKPYEDVDLLAPEMFFGRTAMIGEIMQSRVGKILYGGRRAGKTSILQWLEKRESSPGDGRLYIYVVCRDIKGESYVQQLADEVASTLEQAHVLKASAGGLEFADVLAGIEAWLRASIDRHLTLMLDETNDLVVSDTENEHLVLEKFTLLAERTRRFRLVLAGLHNVQRMTTIPNSVLGQFGRPINVQPFIGDDRIDGVNLVTKPLAALGFEFERPHDALHILAVTNYYPAMIQEYCGFLLNHLHRKSGPAALPYRISPADLRMVEGNRDFTDSLRRKLTQSLELDPRFNLIANIFAFAHYSSPRDREEMLNVDQVREYCLEFGKGLFPEASGDIVEALLDEMVGLAILTVKESAYTLRSPTISSKLGTAESVLQFLQNSETIVMRKEEFSPNEAHDLLGDKEALPINRTQFKQLFEDPKMSTSVVVGCAASGLSRLLSLQESNLRVERMDIQVITGKPGTALETELAEIINDRHANKRKGMKPLVLLIPTNNLWDHQLLQKLQHIEAKMRASHTFVVLMADRAQAEALCENIPDLKKVKIIVAKPWTDVAIRTYAAEQAVDRGDLQFTVPTIRKILELTGGHGPAIEQLIKEAKSTEDLINPSPATRKAIRAPNNLEEAAARFYLSTDIVSALQEIRDKKPRQKDIEEVIKKHGIANPRGRASLLVWFGAVTFSLGGQARLNPMLEQYL